MEYKEAIELLMKMMKKYDFSNEEKEAIRIAVGTLDCGKMADNRYRKVMKSIKLKKESNNLAA